MRPFPDRAIVSAEQTQDDTLEAVARCKKALSTVTGHKYAIPKESGSRAIYSVLSALDGSVMLPDQGIWRDTPKYCGALDKPTNILPTDFGVINPEVLSLHLEKHRPTALFITSFAGYIAEQDVKAISTACGKQGVLLIEDASASLGDEVLAKGSAADIIVGSTRTPKLLNLGAGGFITTDREDIIKRVKNPNKTGLGSTICADMIVGLEKAPHTLKRLTELSELLKKSMDGVIHRDRRGPCVGIRIKNPKKTAKEGKRNGFVTQSGRMIFSICPRYDRFLEKGVVIELKKLDPDHINTEDIESIASFLMDEEAEAKEAE